MISDGAGGWITVANAATELEAIIGRVVGSSLESEQ